MTIDELDALPVGTHLATQLDDGSLSNDHFIKQRDGRWKWAEYRNGGWLGTRGLYSEGFLTRNIPLKESLVVL